ncbi:MAG: hypothetical protein AAB681_00210 [Patescibacteria group bacterium]
MTQDLEKAKTMLTTKNFCFMQWQEDDAIKRGEKVMQKEDMEFLLSINNITRNKCKHSKILDGTYNSELLFVEIEDTKEKGLNGYHLIGATLNQKDSTALKEKGYFIRIEWLGSTMCDEIYFSEEAFIKAEIFDFQNLFGSFASVASLI